jgi:hypothetical protein
MERAKSDSEYNRTIYPSIEKKPHDKSRNTGKRRRSRTSNGCIGGRITLFRFLIKHVARRFITPAMIPMILSDQARDNRSIIGCVENEMMRPPIPVPAELILLAKERFLSNHCEVTATLGMNRNPTPSPTKTPCVMYKCQILDAKLAATRPAVRNSAPMTMGTWVPT